MIYLEASGSTDGDGTVFDLSSLLGAINLSVWAAPDGDEDDTDDNDDADADDGEEDGGTGGTGGDDGKASDDPDKKRLSDEAAKWRRLRKEERLEKEALALKVAELEGKDKTDAEKLAADLVKATERADKAEERAQAHGRKVAIADGSAGKGIDDLKYLGYLLDEDDTEYFDEDGDVADLSDAIDALVKKYPKLVSATGSDNSNDDDESKTTATGKRSDGKGKGKNGIDNAALAAKFPALNR